MIKATALKILFVQQNYLYFGSHFGFNLNLAKLLVEEDGHEVHMLLPIRDENHKIADKNVEVQLNVQYFMPKTQVAPSLIGVNVPLEYDQIYFDIASDLELIDKLRSEKFDVGITETYYLTGYSLAIFHFLEIPVTIATHSQPMAPFHLYLLGVLSKMKTEMHDYIGLPTLNFLPSGEDRLELLNFKSLEVREEQLKLRRQKVWQHCVDQTMEQIKELINQDVAYQTLAEEKYALNTFPSWVEMFRSTRFFFLNSLPEVDFAQFKIVKSIEKVKFIGGFNSNHPSTFNTNATQQTNSLINLMTLGTKEGVILVSFGTVVDTLFRTSSHIIEALVETMESFSNYLFIWKQPKGDLPILKEFKLENVVLQNWINQKEILAHPKTMAFVSHCGMNSVMESTFYGVPMVCMPFFGDQYYNAELLAIQKIGLIIETKNDKHTIQKELNLALSTALGLIKSSEEHFDLDKLKSVSMGIRQKNIEKTISDAMKTIEKEINEKKRQ
uniref:glucuronosyltransferase n=1 Tax=Globodera rostochiensis TaxID=31243 RepID=A0A914I2M7_GLORO